MGKKAKKNKKKKEKIKAAERRISAFIAKKPAQKRVSILKSIAEYFNDVKSELKKVTWPNRQEIITSTIVVVVVVIAFTLFVGIVDEVFIRLIKFLLGGY